MPRTYAIAVVGAAKSGEPIAVPIIQSKAVGCVATFHAPGWRRLAFRSVRQAIEKVANHPNFIRWDQGPGNDSPGATNGSAGQATTA